jgi:CubicO group peptidase (beta-lactamase class C family)
MSYCTYGYGLLGLIIQRVSGKPQADFVRERIFSPLGMADSSYDLPQSSAQRLVRRRAGVPHDWAGEWQLPEVQRGGAGVHSTALDMAVFGQTFLNGGCYGGARVLSPLSVAEMTRDQIPDLKAMYSPELFLHAGWGLGWGIQGNKKGLYYPTLASPRAFSHGGAGGVQLWVDPTYEMVTAYFGVTQVWAAFERERRPFDLFVNAVMAAVVD